MIDERHLNGTTGKSGSYTITNNDTTYFTSEESIKMRLVDANKIGLTDFEILLCDGDFKEALKMLLNKINNAPTIDAAKVVHCKDCKYWHYYGNGYHFCDVFLLAGEYDADSYDSCPDDFCSRGVIKNEKTTY